MTTNFDPSKVSHSEKSLRETGPEPVCVQAFFIGFASPLKMQNHDSCRLLTQACPLVSSISHALSNVASLWLPTSYTLQTFPCFMFFSA